MMKSLLSASAVALLASAGVAPVAAQDATEYSDETRTTAEASKFIGQSIYDSSGQEVGFVEDIVTTADGGKHAVVSVGGFLGIGAKKITIDTADLTPNSNGTGYVTSLTADDMEAAPDYEGDAGAQPM